MLQCPKQLHPLHFLHFNDQKYIADLETYHILAVDELTCLILQLCPSYSNEEIVERLGSQAGEQEVVEVLQALDEFCQAGILFCTDDDSRGKESLHRDHFKILLPQADTYWPDISSTAGGATVAFHYLIEALGKIADVFVPYTHHCQLNEGIYGIPLHASSRRFWMELISKDYDGILLKNADFDQIPICRYTDAPVVAPIFAMRGHGGEMIHRILTWYAAMRPFDAFMIPTDSIRHFYSQFVRDTNCFYKIPLGVDLEHFKPMDKGEAKRQVAQMLGEPRLLERPIVGFLSRFQPEKGAGTYLQVAKMMPEALFLVVVPTLNAYERYPFPDNFVYAIRQKRDQLPLFFNAFDVHCSASVVGEETFGLTVLEAMACGTPVVVPDFDGLPEVAGDAGIVVPAQTFSHEIGSFAGFVKPEALACAIRGLLENPQPLSELGDKARRRALTFTWETCAKRLLSLFITLKQKRDRLRKTDFGVFFGQRWNPSQSAVESYSILSNITPLGEGPLMFAGYPQTVLEGLALSLLKEHTLHEVESVVAHFSQDNHAADDPLDRIEGFIQTAAL